MGGAGGELRIGVWVYVRFQDETKFQVSAIARHFNYSVKDLDIFSLFMKGHLFSSFLLDVYPLLPHNGVSDFIRNS